MQKRWYFTRGRLFAVKTAILAVATLALIPILLWQHVMAATLYVVFLLVVHLVGAFTFAVGVQRHDIAPTPHGFIVRVLGLVVVIALLYLATAGGGLKAGVESAIFWSTLFAIWAIHTGGLALLHLKGGNEMSACPFDVREAETVQH